MKLERESNLKNQRKMWNLPSTTPAVAGNEALAGKVKLGVGEEGEQRELPNYRYDLVLYGFEEEKRANNEMEKIWKEEPKWMCVDEEKWMRMVSEGGGGVGHLRGRRNKGVFGLMV